MMVAGRGGAILSGGDGGTVTRTDGIAPYNTIVGIRFNTNGTVEVGTRINGAAISWSSAGIWIDPESLADSSFSVRYTNRSGVPDFTVKAAVEDTWVGLGAQRTWTMQSTVEETISFTCDFEVRKTAGAPPATGSSFYTFQIQNLP